MKQITKYQCEICRQIHDTAAAAQTCEANHFGLTHQEYLEWKKLSKEASQAGRKIGICKSPETDAAFDEATQNLIGFEEQHGIQTKNRNLPSDFYY